MYTHNHLHNDPFLYMHGLILWNIGAKLLFSLCTPMVSPFSWYVCPFLAFLGSGVTPIGLEWVRLSFWSLNWCIEVVMPTHCCVIMPSDHSYNTVSCSHSFCTFFCVCVHVCLYVYLYVHGMGQADFLFDVLIFELLLLVLLRSLGW